MSGILPNDELTDLNPIGLSLLLKEQLIASLSSYRDFDELIFELINDPDGQYAPPSVFRELQKAGRNIGLPLLYTRGLISELDKTNFWKEDPEENPEGVLLLVDTVARNFTLLLTVKDYNDLTGLPWSGWADIQKMFANQEVQKWMRKSRTS